MAAKRKRVGESPERGYGVLVDCLTGDNVAVATLDQRLEAVAAPTNVNGYGVIFAHFRFCYLVDGSAAGPQPIPPAVRRGVKAAHG